MSGIPIYDWAIRYCLGRSSYAFEDGLSLANEHWDELAISTRGQVLDEVRRRDADLSRYPRIAGETARWTP